MFCEMRGHLRRNAFLSRVHLPASLEQVFRRHALEKVAASSRLEGSLNLNVTLECGQHDNACVRKFCADCDQRINTTYIRKPQIHWSDVRPVFTKRFDAFTAARCLGNQYHVSLAIEHGRDAFAQKDMVIDLEHPD